MWPWMFGLSVTLAALRTREQEKQVVYAAAVTVPNVEELDSILHDVAMRHSGLACRLMQLVECTD